MRAILLALTTFVFANAQAQQYYKDILGARESSELIGQYRKQNVRSVLINSYDEDNQKTGFTIQQQYDPGKQTLVTTTITPVGRMVLTTYTDARDRVIRTVDVAESVTKTTVYTYDEQGRLSSVVTTSSDTAAHKEEHIWKWKGEQPESMLLIKAGRDTTHHFFYLDEQGRVAEERSRRKTRWALPYFYYYNDAGQLSDVVRYNYGARRLLPEMMFEYLPAGYLREKTVVEQATGDYLIWTYKFDERGLKVKEAVYGKQDKSKRLGTVDYQYGFGS
jgi:YD repeat-containing protein